MQTTKLTTAAGLKARAARLALTLLLALCAQAAARAQSAASGPAGGDLAGSYPNPVLASDRVKTSGDSMTGALDITLPNAGSIVTPFKLSTTGNPGAGRGLAFQFHLPWGSSNGVGVSGLGGQITSAWDATGKTYFGFSAYNGEGVSEVFRVSGGGYVGVGTSAPTSRLHVASGTDSAATLLHLESGTGATKGGASFAVSSNASAETGFDLSVRRSGAFTSRFGVSGAGNVYLQPAGSGGVGVGTNAPAATLDVQYAANDGTAGLKLGRAGVSRGFIFSDSDLRVGIDNNNDSATNAFSVYNNGSLASELFRVQEDGDVGVGTSAPAFRLDVRGGQINAGGGLCLAGVCKSSWGEVVGGVSSSQWTTSGTSVHYSSGSVGVGTNAPSTALEVQAADSTLTLSQAGAAGKVTLQAVLGTDMHLSANARGGVGGWSRFNAAQPSWNIFTSPSADFMGIRRAAPGAGAVAWTDVMRINGLGNVGLGTNAPATRLHVVGDVTVDGNIAAKFQDVAEWVPSTQELAAGTVVVLDGSRSNHVLASTAAYDTRVAGVVSARPGLVLGEGGAGRVMVATTGRVRVKVDATRGAIKVGDLLVSSGVEGVAMKSVPVDLAGTPIHRPGTIIGKALEPLERGAGEILVLLSLQ